MQPAEEQGRWELDLWDGSAWFSAWFWQRLQWPAQANRNKLESLRPYLAPGAWEALLLAIRAHLERQEPLELEIAVLVNGQSERWEVHGSVERTPAGQPVYLGGSMRELKSEWGQDPLQDERLRDDAPNDKTPDDEPPRDETSSGEPSHDATPHDQPSSDQAPKDEA